MMTMFYTEERIYKTFQLDKEDTQKLLNKIKELKQRNPQFEVWDEQVVTQEACSQLLEKNAISPILIDDDGWGEEITSVEIYK